MAKEKRSLNDLIKDINKEWKGDIIHLGKPEYDYKRIPFTSPRLNYTTFGGLPLGRLIEFRGDFHSGKTATASDIVANYQRMEGAKGVLYGDFENTYDMKWATTLGVDFTIPQGEPGCVYMMNTENQGAETILQTILDLIETDEIGLVVLDSIGVLVSNQALDKTLDEKTYGGISVALTGFSKQAEALCKKHNCTIIGINQMRADMNNPYGGTTTTGGLGWKHNCSVILEFRQGKFFDDKYKDLSKRAEKPMGNYVEVYMIKNKTCPPTRHNGFYTLKYLDGIDYLHDLIEVCTEEGLINQRGSWFDILDKSTGEVVKSAQGISNLYTLLADEENRDVLIMLEDGIDTIVKGDY